MDTWNLFTKVTVFICIVMVFVPGYYYVYLDPNHIAVSSETITALLKYQHYSTNSFARQFASARFYNAMKLNKYASTNPDCCQRW